MYDLTERVRWTDERVVNYKIFWKMKGKDFRGERVTPCERRKRGGW